MTPEQAAALRAPFPPEVIGKLPKPTRKENPKGNCNVCGGYHGLPAVHLDYVGHAAVTDRLLSVDPDWSWRPMATGEHGEPLFTNGGLWIELTVCGVTRPGFGDDTGGTGTKVIIGDAIRNAAMRFGVALDLWSKEDLHPTEEDATGKKTTDTASSEGTAVGKRRGEPSPSKEAGDGSPFKIPDKAKPQARPVAGDDSIATDDQQAQIAVLIEKVAVKSGATADAVKQKAEKDYGPLVAITEGQANQLIARFNKFLAAAKNLEEAA